MAVETRSQRRKRLAQRVPCRKSPPRPDPAGTCAICLGRLHLWSRHRTVCGHEFHRSCLRQWLQHAETCPLCRCTVDEELSESTWRQLLPVAGIVLGWWLC